MNRRFAGSCALTVLIALVFSSRATGQTIVEFRQNQQQQWTILATTLLGPDSVYVIPSPAAGEWRIRAAADVDMPQVYLKAGTGVGINFSVGEGSLPSTSTPLTVTGHDWGGLITTGDAVKLQVSIRGSVLGRISRVADVAGTPPRELVANLTTGVRCYRIDIGGDFLPSTYDPDSHEIIIREWNTNADVGGVFGRSLLDTLRITAGRVAELRCSGSLLGNAFGREFGDIVVSGNIGAHADFGDAGNALAEIDARGGITEITASNINANIDVADAQGATFGANIGNLIVNGSPGNLIGTVNARWFDGSTEVISIAGSLKGVITWRVASGDPNSGMLLSAQRVVIKGSLASTGSLEFEAANGLDGQVFVNQNGASGAWSSGGTVKVGLGGSQRILTGSTYLDKSTQLGGGAVGQAPFRLHANDCTPPHEFTDFTNPDFVLESDFSSSTNPQVFIRHYGPVQLNATSWNAAVSIECRPLDTAECDSWIDASGGFIVAGPTGTAGIASRTISLARNGNILPRPGIYRVVLRYPPNVAKILSKDIAATPPVIWPGSCNGVGEDAWYTEAYVFTIGPDCDGDGHDDRDPSFPPNTSAPGCQSNCTVADFNLNHSITVQDLFDFLAAYFAGCLTAFSPPSSPCYQSADIGGDGNVGVQDVFDYLEEWFTCK